MAMTTPTLSVQKRRLGRTDLMVSELGLGTVQFGMPYGLPNTRGKLPVVSPRDARLLMEAALEAGINFWDTARGYGDSEAIIAPVLKKHRENVIIATKLPPLDDDMSDIELARRCVFALDQSRQILDVDTIDLLQVHNATPGLLNRRILHDIIAEAKQREWIRFAGVSTYGSDAPRYALQQPTWDTLQVAYNLLDQSMAEMIEEAARKDVGVIVRSVFLKGVLATDAGDLPNPLLPMAKYIKEIPTRLGQSSLTMPQLALGFVLSNPAIATAICGMCDMSELDQNLSTSRLPRFTPQMLSDAKSLNLGEVSLTDPRQWGF